MKKLTFFNLGLLFIVALSGVAAYATKPDNEGFVGKVDTDTGGKIYRVRDGNVVCYIVTSDNTAFSMERANQSSQAISCVKP